MTNLPTHIGATVLSPKDLRLTASVADVGAGGGVVPPSGLLPLTEPHSGWESVRISQGLFFRIVEQLALTLRPADIPRSKNLR